MDEAREGKAFDISVSLALPGIPSGAVGWGFELATSRSSVQTLTTTPGEIPPEFDVSFVCDPGTVC